MLSLRVGRHRLSATTIADGWPSTTESGLQTGLPFFAGGYCFAACFAFGGQCFKQFFCPHPYTLFCVRREIFARNNLQSSPLRFAFKYAQGCATTRIGITFFFSLFFEKFNDASSSGHTFNMTVLKKIKEIDKSGSREVFKFCLYLGITHFTTLIH